MARADLLCEAIRCGLNNDKTRLVKVAEAICAEERAKRHGVLANQIEKIIRDNANLGPRSLNAPLALTGNGDLLVSEKIPEKRLSHLILPQGVATGCEELIEEQLRADLIRSYGVEPRNKILLIGPPGNGKTSLAEAIAEALTLPIFTVKYESVIGSYLGETASRLNKLFNHLKTRKCVLFFDEFETIGKERGDLHETGEIKRVVSSLLLHLDALPSHVVAIAATNHESLLDKAAWRRFQIQLALPKPTQADLEKWLELFMARNGANGFSFGIPFPKMAKKLLGRSYAEAEEFALAVYRQFILRGPEAITKDLTLKQLSRLPRLGPGPGPGFENPSEGLN
ncbi:MAG: ATP-binding protein [Deltaproteobacteria bacterium]|jgi:AAA+ superfamily predicted ATPase|nr:ATP-binding protein [Deltaproteobacteria bacterium]